MVAKGLPGYLAHCPVILMEVFPIVRKYDIRLECLFRSLHGLLDRLELCRERPVDKSMYMHLGICKAACKVLGAVTCLAFPFPLCRHHMPGDTRSRVAASQLQQRCAGADLDVVTVSAEAQYADLAACRYC